MMFLAGRLGQRNERRAAIRAYIAANPAAHIAKIARDLDIPRASLLHHLSHLRRRGELRMVDHASNVRVLPNNHLGDALDALAAQSYPSAAKALQVLGDGKKRGILEVGEALGLTRKQVTNALRRLQAAGLVARDPGRHGKFRVETISHREPGDDLTLSTAGPP